MRPLNRRLGIVGGGQLAQMLALEAAPLGYQVNILSEKESDPAAQVCHTWLSGSPASAKDVHEFAGTVDDLTFESEFFNMEPFLKAQKEFNLQIFPRPELMQTLQNRITQKRLLDQHRVPTAKWLEVQAESDLKTAVEKFPQGFVLKKARGGYDGNGTFYYRKATDLQRLSDLVPGEFLAEALIPFQEEWAVVIARSGNGDCIALPTVRTSQKDSRCDWVIGPVHSTASQALTRALCQFVRKIEYVGVIAFELFKTPQGFLINEIAPRVHNSGHYSQMALTESQFALHLRCGLGLPLAKPILKAKAFAMLNLIGISEQTVQVPLDLQGQLHWYGKNENRPGRKMGHVNYLGQSAQALLKLGLRERKKFQL